MDTKIKRRFWSDPDVEKLDADAKLALLWLFTAHITDAGYVECSERRFEFETGSPWQALLKATEALASSIVRTPKGFFVKNFIREQIGEGERLAKNLMGKSIARSLNEIPADVRSLVFNSYPELEGLAKGLPSPCASSRSTGEERRGEERSSLREELSENGSVDPVTIVRAYCRQDALAECAAAVERDLTTGRVTAAEMLAKVQSCTAFILKFAPNGAMNRLVPRAKTFFSQSQWSEPLVFQHRWETPEKKESGGAVFVKPQTATSHQPPPEGWENAAQEVLGFVPDSWADLPASSRADIHAELKSTAA